MDTDPPVDKLPQIPISDRDWRRTPLAVQALVISLWQRVEHLEQVVEQQAARITALEQELARRRGRSRGGAQSASSASGGPSVTPSHRPASSGRLPGGQPGHVGHGRSLLPAEQVDAVVALKPEHCRHCGHPLHGDDPHPLRHQVVEVPPVRAQVTEYQRHTLRCPHCGTLTEAECPPGVPRGAFGPRLQAWIGLLSGAYRLSHRNITTLLGDAFGVHLAVGSISAQEQQVSAAVAAPVAEAWDHVQRQAAVNLDETGWHEARARAWLWTAAAAGVTVFAIRRHRRREVIGELLGPHCTAIVGSDRYSAYGHLPVARRQLCWAHVRRTFEEFVARGGEAAGVGQRLLAHADLLFTWWHRVRDGTLQRSSFQTYVSDLRARVRFELWYGEQLADAQTAATCANLRAIEPALWTFVRQPGVEPTNNQAERALRHGVVWRHTSFGTHSPAGSRFVERLLTVHESLRQQGRRVLEYLTCACQAALRQEPPPSLLPTAPTAR